MSRFEANFVVKNEATLIQRVTSVMAIADELKNKDMIHDEKYAEIKAEGTNQGKMRKLFEALHSGGDRVKNDFYYALKHHEPFLFKDLGGRVTTENTCEVDSSEQNLQESMR
ncbi:NACHT, LRR and PYD domains-containing protein 1a allele 5-like [Megalobrama amblycephala]|uniref:NACHT, LRR and PYD domains-containing protein 1a allele 5-like n=1 Tax=Megalobrama amblycephala TaxID=75352 RepID=UPI0020140CD9|nr:NACHT, LRR and PYD domains-containing protein 1a allele 5-like [Megalobrama amblycephala]